MQRRPVARVTAPQPEPPGVPMLHGLIQAHPTFGDRRLWALLCRQHGMAMNRKAVYRVLR